MALDRVLKSEATAVALAFLIALRARGVEMAMIDAIMASTMSNSTSENPFFIPIPPSILGLILIATMQLLMQLRARRGSTVDGRT